jgi:hypothetical protein
MGWRDSTPKEKGESFDAQYAHSQQQAAADKAAGRGPYATDAAIANAGKPKPAEKRGKGKHRK